jgi:hypothetical protein
MSYAPLCAICKQPVNLEESKTNEHGHAVHENCYIWIVELKKPRRRIINVDARHNHLCSEPTPFLVGEIRKLCASPTDSF